MRHKQSAVVILVMVGALAFGALMSVIHGDNGGLRATIGNLSAPWLLIGFGAGALLGNRGLWRGAAAGLAVTVSALVAFYLTYIYVLGLTGHGAIGDLRLALGDSAYYIRFGLFTGPFMGAIGALWRRRRSLGLALAATSLLVFEPLAWFTYFHGHVTPQWDFPPVAIAEVAAGLCLSTLVVVRERQSVSAHLR